MNYVRSFKLARRGLKIASNLHGGISSLTITHHRLYSVNKPDFRKESEGKYFEFKSLEQKIYSWWEESGHFKPNPNPSAKKFVLPMPPPNVTGYLHMGHAIFLALQDIMARYYRMKGYSSLWVPGTDHAGIATQLLVERSLQKDGLNRLTLGREAFLDKVWQWKEEKGDYIIQQMKRLGASADWSRGKFTLDQDMNEAVTEAFIQLYDKGLIYRGNYLVNWSPHLMTAVSDLEVEYSEEEGTLYYFKYYLSDGKEDVFIPVATTRPETILGDTAVCVHPEDPRYQHLIGKMVEVPIIKRQIPVIADEYVDREFGTGALKITPAHDVNDYTLGKKHHLPMINVMNKDATMNGAMGSEAYQGLDRFQCREQLWQDMKKAGYVLKEEKHMQRIPRSQRGGEVIEPMVSSQWFVKMESMAEKAIQAVRQKDLQIIPERFEKTWFNWLENIRDWCISRQLWWGHRIPVYYVLDHEQKRVVDDQQEPVFVVAKSQEEALQLAQRQYGGERDGEREGKKVITVEQDEDVLDTWFSSGLWPFATVGWPHTQQESYQRFYPADVLETGYDILFFWVARMVTMGIELTGKSPFHTIYLHGLVRDSQGQKMSKTKGNVIDPIDTLEQFGSDALRYSLVTGSTPGQDIPLSMERIESNRNFVNKLWNAGKYIQNALQTVEKDHDNETQDYTVKQLMTKEDIERLLLPEQYIVSRCHELVNSVSEQLTKYQFGEAGRAIYEFLWDELADWYIEVSKCHLRSDDLQSRQNAARVLVYVWDISLRLLHPFMPYVTETLWQQIPHQGESIMTAAWPDDLQQTEATATTHVHKEPLYVDQQAMKNFRKIQNLVRSVRNARAEYNVDVSKKVPLIVRASDEILAALVSEKKAFTMLARLDEDKLSFLSWQDVSPATVSGGAGGPFVHLIVEEDVEAYLPQSGLLDRDKETARLSKQGEKLKKDIEVLEGRLANKNFTDKAPKHLVEEVQSKLAEIKQQLQTVERSLKSLLASV